MAYFCMQIKSQIFVAVCGEAYAKEIVDIWHNLYSIQIKNQCLLHCLKKLCCRNCQYISLGCRQVTLKKLE